jgi:hypothetical protein
LIYISWLQHPDSAAFRQCFARAAEIAIRRNCRFWLSDARAVHYLEFADQNWILQFMVPLLFTSKLLKFARINSEESLSLLDVDRILQNLEAVAGIKYTDYVALFLNRQKAVDWLFPVSQPQGKVLLPNLG